MALSNTRLLSFNNSELLILKELAEMGESSAYDIAKKSGRSYPSIFRYCKILNNRGLLTLRTVTGEKNSEKTIYKLSLMGLILYIGGDLATSWVTFGFPGEFSKYQSWFNSNLDSVELSNWLDNFSKTLAFYSDQDPVFDLSKRLENAKSPKKSRIILCDFLIYICRNTEIDLLDSSNHINQQTVRERLYNAIEESIFDIINEDALPPEAYIDIIHSFIAIPSLWKRIEDLIYYEFNYLIDALNRFNSLLPEKNEYIDNLQKIEFPQ